MRKIIKTFDRWLGRAASIATFWPWVPAGIVAVLGGFLASGVEQINQYGSLGWFLAGLFAFFLSAAAFALLARARLWRIDSAIRGRDIGDGSPFDPMAKVYQNKRLYLRDLAPSGRRAVIGKTFINCEIIGPGVAMLMTRSSEELAWPTMQNNRMHDVDCIEMDPNVLSSLAVYFPDCNFQNCHFFNLALLFSERSDGPKWHWITPDTRPLLQSPEDTT